MLLVREVFYCKPGKVRPLVEKFLDMNKLSMKAGMPKMRIMTDFTAERYWMLVAEMEVKNMEEFETILSGAREKEGDMKEMETLMKGYHDLVDHGRREIYRIEGWCSSRCSFSPRRAGSKSCGERKRRMRTTGSTGSNGAARCYCARSSSRSVSGSWRSRTTSRGGTPAWPASTRGDPRGLPRPVLDPS